MRACAGALVLCGLVSCGEPPHVVSDVRDDSPALASDDANGAIEVVPLEVGPLAFFNDACARCHGDDGWSFAPGFDERYTRETMREIVHEMVIGPSQRELGTRETTALSDLHFTLGGGEGVGIVALIEEGALERFGDTDGLTLEGRGAWAWRDASGRVFGEVDSGEVEAAR